MANTPTSSQATSKLYLYSGAITSTIKDSADVSTTDNNIHGIGYDASGNCAFGGNANTKFYYASGCVTNTIKDSASVSTVSIVVATSLSVSRNTGQRKRSARSKARIVSV